MRLFFAIALPEGIRQKLKQKVAELKELGLDASFVKDEQLHLTLLFLGEKDEQETARIISQCRVISFPKFALSIKSAGFFPNEGHIRVFWVGAEAEGSKLQELHSQIASACNMKPEKDFMGHITLARIKSRKNVQGLLGMRDGMLQEVFGEFTTEYFQLMKSDLQPQGAKYSVVERFELK